MAENSALEIITVSGACCMPHQAKQDKTLETTLQAAIGELGVPVNVRKVSLSALLAGGGDLAAPQRQQVLALFQRYGAAFCPAVMIGGQVRFAGVLPTVAQLKEALQAATVPQS